MVLENLKKYSKDIRNFNLFYLYIFFYNLLTKLIKLSWN